MLLPCALLDTLLFLSALDVLIAARLLRLHGSLVLILPLLCLGMLRLFVLALLITGVLRLRLFLVGLPLLLGALWLLILNLLLLGALWLTLLLGRLPWLLSVMLARLGLLRRALLLLSMVLLFGFWFLLCERRGSDP
jgi:hypothetical protein